MSYRTNPHHHHGDHQSRQHDGYDNRHDGSQQHHHHAQAHQQYDARAHEHRHQPRGDERHHSHHRETHHRETPAARPQQRPAARQAPAQPAAPAKTSGFTVGHGRRQVRVGPVAFWTIVGTLVIMAGWSIVTATYFAFHDDVLTRLISRQAEMQFAYEDRIADLRAQVDRVTSRQLLDQEQFEQKLDTMLRRQSTLESRAATIGAVAADPVVTGTVRAPARGSSSLAPDAATGIPRPSPISDRVLFVAPPDRDARLESRGAPLPSTRFAARTARGGIEGTLTRFKESLDRVEVRQARALEALEESFDAKARRMRGVLVDLGLDVSKLAPAKPATATGGPFVPARLASDSGAFERHVQRIQQARLTVDRLNKALGSVPVRKPIAGEIDSTSGFGVRMDPFVRSMAMHTGLDMRGSTGDPVRATATGTVTTAGWNGGYGKMVEIDHGNGLTTRYGHLSAIDVEVGQTVRIGQIVGKIGSTGRSTGPHLHYETRVDGEAVDPQKFLRAGLRLGNNH